MKVIVDIKNKTLKMLENERSIFKGEYSADKLELYINKQLENEYPVITGLLSNGRRIGAFTTDDGYEMETIDGVEYTKAKFTLSKENGFPLSAGVTQITIWMYRTKDSVLVSKEAIGNVVFTVVDTTAFNDGDVIISGDVEGTVVNLKVELENLQGRLEQYLPLSGAKAMTGDLPMKGNNIIFDNGNEETIEIGEEDNEYSMSIRMEDSDYYKGRYRASGFSVGNDYIDAELDISESRFTMTFAGDSSSTITPSGFSVNKEGETFYEDGRIGRYLDNSFTKHVEIKLPNKSGELALKEDIPTKTSELTNDSNFLTEHQDISGKADKTELDNYLPLTGGTVIGNIKALEFTLPNGALISSYSGQNYKDIRILAIGPDDNTIKSGTIHMGTTLPRMGENSWSSTFTFDMDNNALYSSAGDSLSLGLSDKQWWKVYGKQIYQDGKQVANKEDIPTKVSQLENDSGLITNAVDDLTNYYLKSETYTKSEVQQLFSTISGLKLEVVTNLPTTNISSNTIYLKPLDSAKENNIYEEYIYINSKWETIGTTAVDLSNYALKTDISGKADKTELDNYLPYTTGIADSAKNIYWTTRLNGFQFDIESTKPSIKFDGDRVGYATITPNKIELNGTEGGAASILLDGKQVALQENIPTKLSQLEQDVELGVNEEDVMNIIENNAEQTNTLDIGTSATFNPESDKQIPTSKAVANMMDNAGGSNNIIDLGKCFYNDVEYEDQYYYDLAIKIYNESKDDPTRTYIGVISDNEFKFAAWYDSADCSVMIMNESLNEKITIYEPQDIENRELYKQSLSLYGTSGVTVEGSRITLDRKTENVVASYNRSDGAIHCFEMGIFGGNCFIWYDYLLTFTVENNSYVYKIYLQDGNYYPVSQIIELPYKSEMIKHKVIFTYIEGEEEGYLTIQPIEGSHLMYDGIATVKLSAITRNEFKF